MEQTRLLDGKSVFITGGSRGIGCVIVRRFLHSGSRYVAYFSREKSKHHDELAAIAEERGATLVHYPGSVNEESSVEEAIKHFAADAQSLDVVINNAGITRDKFIIGMKQEDWQQVLDVNLTGAFYVCKTATALMAKKRSGSIINVSSIVGITGNPGQTNYSASKAGLIGLSKSLAREVAKRSVRVNVIAPGFIETEMTDAIAEPYKAKIIEQIPMARIGEPEEVADVAVFLASNMARYITGQVLSVAGGMGV